MEMLKRFDLRMVFLIEALCRVIERQTGKSNLFWLECLSGGYAIALGLYLWYANDLLASNIRIIGVMLVLAAFVVSFVLTARAKTAAAVRSQEGIENPSKTDAVHRYLRLILFFDIVSPIMCYGYFSILHPDQMFSFGVLVFMTTLVGTFTLFWVCTLLYACDPLPKNKNSA